MREFVFISGGNIGRQIATLLAQVLMAKKLGGTVFGELTFAFSIYFVLAGLSDFGSRLYCWKFVLTRDAAERVKQASRLFILKIFVALLLLVPINLAVWLTTTGSLSRLLHLYSFAVVFNQAAFDWYFFSLDKGKMFFYLNLLSGVFYLLTVVLLVHGPNDVFVIPILLALSYALPGTVLMVKSRYGAFSGIFRLNRILSLVKEALRLPLSSYRYLPYDLLQRTYSIAILIVAGGYFDKRLLGEFRVAHLLYSFVAATAIYLGSSFFNRVAEEIQVGGATGLISEGVGLVCLIVVPISLVGPDIVPAIAEAVLGREYREMHTVLSLLMLGLIFPAIGNFVREAAISTPYSRIASVSFAVSMFVTILGVVFYHPQRLVALGTALLAGEFAGLIVLFKYLPLKLVPKRWVFVAGVSLMSILIMKGAVYVISVVIQDHVGIRVLICNFLATSCIYLIYIGYINKNFKTLLKERF